MAEKKSVVAMLVDNAVYGDARVVKTARTVKRLGYDVHVLGLDVPSSWSQSFAPDLQVTLARVAKGGKPRTYVRVTQHPFAYRNRRRAREAAANLTARSLEARTHAALEDRWLERLGVRARGSTIAAGWAVYRLRSRQLDRAVAEFEEASSRWVAGAKDRDPKEVAADDRLLKIAYPRMYDFEAAWAPHLERIKPDIIHAHDRSVGAGVRAAVRARRAGRQVSVIYDAHEFVPGVVGPQGPSTGLIMQEAAHIRLADAIVTVSPPLADLLVRTHGLGQVPAVTLNAPDSEALDGDPTFTRDVRADCGLAEGVPLLVYSGGIAPRRGLATAVAGLAQLPGVHLAVIADKSPKERQELQSIAESLGVSSRLHLLDYVPRSCIIQHLRAADVAIIPILHTGSHEIAMPNKFFDYVQAGLPMVVSDTEYLAKVVSEQHLGRVHAAGDPESFAEATQDVLADHGSFRRSVAVSESFGTGIWDAQRPVLEGVYQSLS